VEGMAQGKLRIAKRKIAKSKKAPTITTTMTMLIIANGEGEEERYGIQKNRLETTEIHAQANRAELN